MDGPCLQVHWAGLLSPWQLLAQLALPNSETCRSRGRRGDFRRCPGKKTDSFCQSFPGWCCAREDPASSCRLSLSQHARRLCPGATVLSPASSARKHCKEDGLVWSRCSKRKYNEPQPQTRISRPISKPVNLSSIVSERTGAAVPGAVRWAGVGGALPARARRLLSCIFTVRVFCFCLGVVCLADFTDWSGTRTLL